MSLSTKYLHILNTFIRFLTEAVIDTIGVLKGDRSIIVLPDFGGNIQLCGKLNNCFVF